SIANIAEQATTVGAAIVITNTATDPNDPPRPLTFGLGAGAPAGAAINPTNGIFSWTPICAQGSTTNLIEMRVTASGNPPVTSSVLFYVAVGECVQQALAGVAVVR